MLAPVHLRVVNSFQILSDPPRFESEFATAKLARRECARNFLSKQFSSEGPRAAYRTLKMHEFDRKGALFVALYKLIPSKGASLDMFERIYRDIADICRILGLVWSRFFAHEHKLAAKEGWHIISFAITFDRSLVAHPSLESVAAQLGRSRDSPPSYDGIPFAAWRAAASVLRRTFWLFPPQ